MSISELITAELSSPAMHEPAPKQPAGNPTTLGGRLLDVESGGEREGRERREIGRVISVTGAEARIGIFADMLQASGSEDVLTVGKFVGIRRNRLLVTGIISQVSTEIPLLTREDGYEAIANVDLMGEFMNADDDLQHAHFLRWITSYPTVGDRRVLVG